MQQKSQKKPELDNGKPAAVVAPLTTGYTVKISNCGWDQSDKFVEIYITLSGVHQVPTENVQVHFTERSLDLVVKNPQWQESLHDCEQSFETYLCGKQSKKVKTDTVMILCREKAENTQWDYLTQVERVQRERKAIL